MTNNSTNYQVEEGGTIDILFDTDAPKNPYQGRPQ